MAACAPAAGAQPDAASRQQHRGPYVGAEPEALIRMREAMAQAGANVIMSPCPMCGQENMKQVRARARA